MEGEIMFFVFIVILCISLICVTFKLCEEPAHDQEEQMEGPLLNPTNPPIPDIRQALHSQLVFASNRRIINPRDPAFNYSSLPSNHIHRSSSPTDSHEPESPNIASIPTSPNESIQQESFVPRSPAINISRNTVQHIDLPPSYEEAMRRFNSV